MSIAALLMDPVALVGKVASFVVNNAVAEVGFYAWAAAALVIILAAEIAAGVSIVKRYTSPAVRSDFLYAVIELSHLQALILIAPIAAGLNGVVDAQFPALRFEAVRALPFWVQLAIAIIVTDFFGYWWHRMKHINPWLWQLHKVHHAQTDLNMFTRFRFPFLDRFFDLFYFFPLGVVTGSPTLPLALYGFVILRSCLEHSGFGWTYGPLGKIIVSPAFHRIHHSHDDVHRDRNFSNLFIIWDRLFGTYADIRDVPTGYGVASEAQPFGIFYGVTAPVKGWYQLAHERFVRNQVVSS